MGQTPSESFSRDGIVTPMRPWGTIDWLFPKLSVRAWELFFCASFEERSSALAEWCAMRGVVPKSAHFLRINDPVNRFTDEVERLTDTQERRLREFFPKSTFYREDLLAQPAVWNSILSQALPDAESVILDISTLPKRVFLFIVKRLLAKDSLKNLIVCYTRAGSYPEGVLTQDSNPIEALPGFARVSEGTGASLVVGVGYVAFDINQLIEQVQAVNLHFMFPFPPGSPAFRRNWRLIRQLMPQASIPLEIHRIHAMDMFAALDWLKQIGSDADGDLDMVALGPKPHSLAMGLASLSVGETSQVMYSQPKLYHPSYSIGVARGSDGAPEIYAYCLKRHGVSYI
ncbi:hypothetical protein [Rhodanobacter sp. UC4436_H3]